MRTRPDHSLILIPDECVRPLNKEAAIMSGLKWLNNFEAARDMAISTKKLVLLFFHSPACSGCKKTLETTFTDPAVAELLEGDFACVKYNVLQDENMTACYKVEWTPTFMITDSDGRELERWVGYLPPDEFITQVHLSEGLAEMHAKRFKAAETAFEWIIDHRPDSEAAPEARYYMGVALYKDTGDARHLERTWETMSKRYPSNNWTKKASAWS